MKDGSKGMPRTYRSGTGRHIVRRVRGGQVEPTMRTRQWRWPCRATATGCLSATAARSPGLAVSRVLAVARAELLQLDAVRVVAAVLARDVVAVLALHTRQSDLRTYVGRLSHGGV